MKMLPNPKNNKIISLSPTSIKEEDSELANSVAKSKGTNDFHDERRLIKEAMQKRNIGSIKIMISDGNN